jgi:hypothetical protein
MTDPHHMPRVEEEPLSPPWLPALGVALFVAAGIAWSLCRGDHPSASAGVGAAPASASAPPPSAH